MHVEAKERFRYGKLHNLYNQAECSDKRSLLRAIAIMRSAFVPNGLNRLHLQNAFSGKSSIISTTIQNVLAVRLYFMMKIFSVFRHLVCVNMGKPSWKRSDIYGASHQFRSYRPQKLYIYQNSELIVCIQPF